MCRASRRRTALFTNAAGLDRHGDELAVVAQVLRVLPHIGRGAQVRVVVTQLDRRDLIEKIFGCRELGVEERDRGALGRRGRIADDRLGNAEVQRVEVGLEVAQRGENFDLADEVDVVAFGTDGLGQAAQGGHHPVVAVAGDVRGDAIVVDVRPDRGEICETVVGLGHGGADRVRPRRRAVLREGRVGARALFGQLRLAEFARRGLGHSGPQTFGLELVREIDLTAHDAGQRRDGAGAIGVRESLTGADAREPRHRDEGHGEHEHQLRTYVEIPEHGVWFSARNCLRHRPKLADLELFAALSKTLVKP